MCASFQVKVVIHRIILQMIVTERCLCLYIITGGTSSYPGWIKSPHVVTLGILKILDLNSLTIFGWLGGGYFGVNFGHPKSEVFHNGGGGISE